MGASFTHLDAARFEADRAQRFARYADGETVPHRGDRVGLPDGEVGRVLSLTAHGVLTVGGGFGVRKVAACEVDVIDDAGGDGR